LEHERGSGELFLIGGGDLGSVLKERLIKLVKLGTVLVVLSSGTKLRLLGAGNRTETRNRHSLSNA